MQPSGIYQLLNTVTGGCYMGQSVNVFDRKRGHFAALRNGKHVNRHLQYAYHKHGEGSFRFRVLLYCEPSELTRYEQAVTDLCCPSYKLRLLCVESNRGNRVSKETKVRMSKAQKGRIITPEAREKMSRTKRAAHRHWSEQEKQQRRVWSTGLRHTEEVKAGISKHLMGHTFSEETRAKISKALIGRVGHNRGIHFSEEVKRRMSERMRGTKQSEETKRKRSVALMGHRGWSKGIRASEETKQKLRGRTPWSKGKKIGPLSTEVRLKMSAAQKERRSREALGAAG